MPKLVGAMLNFKKRWQANIGIVLIQTLVSTTAHNRMRQWVARAPMSVGLRAIFYLIAILSYRDPY